MTTRKSKLLEVEIQFFRALNRVIEPLVRKGLGSPRLVPTGFVVLETLGRVSKRWRRTPLAATRLGRYVLVSTLRGRRSQWIRNLQAKPQARLWLGGKQSERRALLLHEGQPAKLPADLPLPLRALVEVLVPFTRVGWAFAILVPVKAVSSKTSSRRKRR